MVSVRTTMAQSVSPGVAAAAWGIGLVLLGAIIVAAALPSWLTTGASRGGTTSRSLLPTRESAPKAAGTEILPQEISASALVLVSCFSVLP